MRQTLTAKIISDHLAGESGEEIELRVDEILLEDATGTMACLQFERLGLTASRCRRSRTSTTT